MRLVAEAGASIIQCASIDTEPLGIGYVMFTKPLEVGDTLVCTGTYTLTSDDVENLRRQSLVTVEAKDEGGYHVGMSVTRIVPLDQASINTPLSIASAVTTGHACNVSCFQHTLSGRDASTHILNVVANAVQSGLIIVTLNRRYDAVTRTRILPGTTGT